MAAGGYKEFVAGETLDQDEINDYLMQGMLVFAGTAARGSAIGTPVEGQFTYLSDTDAVEFYDGSAWVALETGLPVVEYVVIGGGGGGFQGGGGAGGYQSSVGTENSGGTATAQQRSAFVNGAVYNVTVGAGGPGQTSGSPSVFGSIDCAGGGRGGKFDNSVTPQSGGSGGGGGASTGAGHSGAAGTTYQGFAGGNGIVGPNGSAGGGGGAGAAGQNAPSNGVAGNGGAGVSSTITGSSVGRAGGGGGGAYGGTAGTASDGGGAGAPNGTVNNGTANTGGGGGGNNDTTTNSAGGSGVVILKYPSKVSLTVGAGLTSSTVTSGNNKITTFTAGTDTVTVSF